MTRSTHSGLDVWLVDLALGEQVLHAFDRDYQLVPPGSPQPGTARAWPGASRQQAARIAHRVLLASYVGLESARHPFVVGPAGKPSLRTALVDEPVDFSLTHCDAAALIAISNAGAIGIDIEVVRPVRINPARRAMLEDAAAALAPHEPLPVEPDDRRFLQAWVRLEAVAKATGEGISALLGRLGTRGSHRLAVQSDMADQAPMLVQDLSLDSRPSLLAAIAGAADLLGPGVPRPTVKQMPLDRLWLEAVVADRLLCLPQNDTAPTG